MTGDINNIAGNLSPLLQIISIVWISAILSSMIDNIPITKVLIPIVKNFVPSTSPQQINSQYYYGLAIGANWGDNLTPLGDNILVMNLAEQGKRPIKVLDFFKLGFTTTIYQLCLATLYFVAKSSRSPSKEIPL